MNGYYIHYDARMIIGVSKKIDLQIRELRRVSSVEEIVVPLKSKNFVRNALAVLPFLSLSWDYTEAYAKIVKPDFLYVRGIGYDRKACTFLKWVKKCNPNCLILVELPTYPYAREQLRSIQGIVLFPKTLWNRRRISKYIDRYVLTVQGYEYVNGVKTISIRNGVDVDGTIPVSPTIPKDDTVRLSAIAMMQSYHGYERLINGLEKYYSSGGKRKVEVYLVGKGPEVGKYKKMVTEKGLQEYIHFPGEKSGDELDEIYDHTDLAVECLGCYKNGIYKLSSLKCCEYLAKGLPVLSGVENEMFGSQEVKFICRVPNDESPIDILAVMNFYDKIYSGTGREEITRVVRQFAKEKADIQVTFQPLLHYLKEQ